MFMSLQCFVPAFAEEPAEAAGELRGEASVNDEKYRGDCKSWSQQVCCSQNDRRIRQYCNLRKQRHISCHIRATDC